MRRLTILLVLVAGVAWGEEGDSKWVDDIASRAFSSRPGRDILEADAKAAQLQLRSAKTAKVVSGKPGRSIPMLSPAHWHRYIQFPTKEAKLAAITQWDKISESRSALIKDGGKLQPPELDDKPHVGSAGTVWRGELKIVQVIDEKNAIVSMIRASAASSISRGVPMTRYRAVPHDLWMQVDARDWADGSTIKFSTPVLITGTKQYETVSGASKTLFVARPWTDPERTRFDRWKPLQRK